MSHLRDRTVLITGASAGIGEACARAFAAEGCRLVLAARRVGRIDAAAADLRAAGAPEVVTGEVDVRDFDAVREFAEALPRTVSGIDVLVNNAGLSRGLHRLHEGELRDWNEMIDTNIKGLLHVNRAVIPGMVAAGRGTVIHIGSIAGRSVYPGGNVYCATKYAVRALTESLRIELNGTGVRVCSIDPGLVETEFSVVRFRGDDDRARAVYDGMTPLTPDDVAEAVLFAAGRPPHVTIADTMILPTDQASATTVHRRTR